MHFEPGEPERPHVQFTAFPQSKPELSGFDDPEHPTRANPGWAERPRA
jgi:hypothetical protein